MGEPRPSEVTQETLYLKRRQFMKNAGLFAATSVGVGGTLLSLLGRGQRSGTASDQAPLDVARRSDLSIDEPTTPWGDVTAYNNFYEFGIGKGDPAQPAHRLQTRPWTVSIEGEVHKPRVVDVDELLRFFPLEERVYRMRCVEAWSMVIPWVGFPLAALLRRFEPPSRARYVELTTLLDPAQMPLPSRSTATPSRWPACMPAWTPVATSEDEPGSNAATPTLVEARSLRGGAGALSCVSSRFARLHAPEEFSSAGCGRSVYAACSACSPSSTLSCMR